MEIWRDIEQYPGYQVSNQGQIKSFKQSKEGHILKPKISAGYAGVDFRKDGKSYYGLIHRIVLSTFAPVEGWETLTVHINRLRKKFDCWNSFEIVSVRGLGYKGVIK